MSELAGPHYTCLEHRMPAVTRNRKLWTIRWPALGWCWKWSRMKDSVSVGLYWFCIISETTILHVDSILSVCLEKVHFQLILRHFTLIVTLFYWLELVRLCLYLCNTCCTTNYYVYCIVLWPSNKIIMQ